MVDAAENGTHERLTDETAAVVHPIALAETVKHPLLTVIEQYTDTILTRLLLHIRTKVQV